MLLLTIKELNAVYLQGMLLVTAETAPGRDPSCTAGDPSSGTPVPAGVLPITVIRESVRSPNKKNPSVT